MMRTTNIPNRPLAQIIIRAILFLSIMPILFGVYWAGDNRSLE